MKVENFDRRIVDLCAKRDIKLERDVSPPRYDYYLASSNLVINIEDNDVIVFYRDKEYYFDWDTAIVRIKENMNGFEIKFDISIESGIYKLKIFVVGGNPYSSKRYWSDDPYDILKENEGDWIKLSDLAYMSKVSRYEISSILQDREGVETQLRYEHGKRHPCYYRYVQKDSETLSPEE